MINDELDTEFEDPRARAFDYKNNTFTIKASDPYGLWTIHRSGGKTPDSLAGQYTSFENAKEAVIVHYSRIVTNK